MSEIVFCHFYLLLQILIRAKWFLIHGTLIRTYVPSKASCADPGRKQEICLRHWGRSQRNQCGFKVLLHVLSNLSDLSWTHVWYSPTKMFETVPMCLRADDSTRSCLAWRKKLIHFILARNYWYCFHLLSPLYSPCANFWSVLDCLVPAVSYLWMGLKLFKIPCVSRFPRSAAASSTGGPTCANSGQSSKGPETWIDLDRPG